MFESLPDELLLSIFSLLPPKDLRTGLRLSHRFSQLIEKYADRLRRPKAKLSIWTQCECCNRPSVEMESELCAEPLYFYLGLNNEKPTEDSVCIGDNVIISEFARKDGVRSIYFFAQEKAVATESVMRLLPKLAQRFNFTEVMLQYSQPYLLHFIRQLKTVESLHLEGYYSREEELIETLSPNPVHRVFILSTSPMIRVNFTRKFFRSEAVQKLRELSIEGDNIEISVEVEDLLAISNLEHLTMEQPILPTSFIRNLLNEWRSGKRALQELILRTPVTPRHRSLKAFIRELGHEKCGKGCKRNFNNHRLVDSSGKNFLHVIVYLDGSDNCWHLSVVDGTKKKW